MAIFPLTFTAEIDSVNIPLLSAEVRVGYRQDATTFKLVTPLTNTTLALSVSPNQSVDIVAGLGTPGPLMTNGLVDRIVASRREETVTITGRDRLKLAIEYWLAPLVFGGTSLLIPAGTTLEAAIALILAQAGLTTDLSLGASGGTVLADVSLQVVSAMDVINEIQLLNSWKVYCTQDGIIRYGNIKPFPGGVLPSVGTITNFHNLSMDRSDEWLRNRILVTGGGFMSVASASSPYLPAGYYKTGAFDMPNWAQSQEDVDQVAAVALALTNRLTVKTSFTVKGNPLYWVGKGFSAAEATTGMTGNWSFFTVIHQLDAKPGGTGYTVMVEAVQ